MKDDIRKKNGGAREGSGRKAIDPEERKVPVWFYVKKKLVEHAKKKINPIVDKINEEEG